MWTYTVYRSTCSHLKKFILWKSCSDPSYSVFTKIEMKGKAFLRGVHRIMYSDSFIISFQFSCMCLYGIDAAADHTSWPQTQIPLTGQQVSQIILPHQGMKYLQKLCFDHVFLFLSRDAHLCAHCQWWPTDGMVTSSICSRFPSSVFICTSKKLHQSHSSQRQTCKMFFVPQSSHFDH